jgi:hypothetical protein
MDACDLLLLFNPHFCNQAPAPCLLLLVLSTVLHPGQAWPWRAELAYSVGAKINVALPLTLGKVL